MKKIALIIMLAFASSGVFAQSSAPAPGSVNYGTPIGWNPGLSVPNNMNSSAPAPGSPAAWNPVPGASSAPAPGTPVNNPAFAPQGWCGNSLMWTASPMSWQSTYANPNSGTVSVMGCGYDDEGVWRQIPLNVAYDYNGVNYDVTVLNAWNPWTDSWNDGIDAEAFQTSYYANGVTYNYYAPLSTGTYYFNL